MRELGLGAYRFSIALAARGARRRPARSTRRGSTSTTGSSTSCSRRASRRGRPSTTGTCRMPLEDARAGGATATPSTRFVEYALHVHERLGDRVARLADDQRAVVRGLPGLRHGRARPGRVRPRGLAGRGAPPAAGPRAGARGPAGGRRRARSAAPSTSCRCGRRATTSATSTPRGASTGCRTGCSSTRCCAARYPEDVLADVAGSATSAHVRRATWRRSPPRSTCWASTTTTRGPWRVTGSRASGRREWVGSPHVRFVEQPLPDDRHGLVHRARPACARRSIACAELAPGLPLAITENGAAYPRVDSTTPTAWRTSTRTCASRTARSRRASTCAGT